MRGGSVLKRTYEQQQQWSALWFILPSTITLILLVSYPLIYGVGISFFSTNLTTQWNFTGLDNYLAIFRSSSFLSSIGTTFQFTFLVVVGNMIIGTVLAVILNTDIPGRTFFRVLLIIPWLIPEVVIGLLWRWIFNPMYGLLSNTLVELNLISEPLNILGSYDLALYGVVVAAIWKGYPLVLVIVLAGLQTISKDLYEAAEIDGSNTWQSFRYITLPSLKPVLLILLILETVWWFKNFPIVWLMTNGGPVNSTEVISIGVFKAAFESFRFGQAAAMSVIIFFICLLISYIYRRLMPDDD